MQKAKIKVQNDRATANMQRKVFKSFIFDL